MAEAEQSSGPVGPTGGPATPPKVLPWLLMYTVGRLGIWAVLTFRNRHVDRTRGTPCRP